MREREKEAEELRPAAPEAPPQASGVRPVHILSLLLAAAITAAIFYFRDVLVRFAAYGYLGLFVITLVGNATVILPVPGLVAVYAAGGAFNPWIVGLVAGVAQALGEMTGYLAGYGGGAALAKRPNYARVRGWMEQRGFLTILVLSFIPNPLFDVAGITAGALRMPLGEFLLACLIGKTAKSLLVALAGLLSWQGLSHLLRGLGGG
ncbi:MAG: YqaA family protein [Anaerolineae bacterium]